MNFCERVTGQTTAFLQTRVRISIGYKPMINSALHTSPFEVVQLVTPYLIVYRSKIKYLQMCRQLGGSSVATPTLAHT